MKRYRYTFIGVNRMKNVIFMFITIVICFSGCYAEKYDYSNWHEYELKSNNGFDSAYFNYPENWIIDHTSNDLISFYEIDGKTNKTIVAFQSKSFSVADNYTQNEGDNESNAYSKNFKSVKPLNSQIGKAHGFSYGRDLIVADGEKKELRYIDYLHPIDSSDSIESDKFQIFRLYFTDRVSMETYRQICNSCK